MTKAEAIVLHMLIRDTKPDGTARTSIDDLAKRAAMTERTVRRAIHSLIKNNDIRRIKIGVPGKASLYTVFPMEVIAILNPWVNDQQSRGERKEEPGKGGHLSTQNEGLGAVHP
jgi:hypothetical protein